MDPRDADSNEPLTLDPWQQRILDAVIRGEPVAVTVTRQRHPNKRALLEYLELERLLTSGRTSESSPGTA